MQVYGDESGHLRSLLDGKCERFILAIVAGGEHECGGCPKRAVRRATDMEEAKWSDMSENEKRRAIDCLNEQERGLDFGYVSLDENDIQRLSNSYLLYQDRAFDIDWDLAVIGRGYSTLLTHISSQTERGSCFTFDRLFGVSQSDQIADVIRREHDDLAVEHGSSRQIRGIQAADCLAGAIAETYEGRRNWIDEFDTEIACQTAELADVLDEWLRNVGKTAP